MSRDMDEEKKEIIDNSEDITDEEFEEGFLKLMKEDGEILEKILSPNKNR